MRMSDFTIPVSIVGPGSQSAGEGDAELAFMPMPAEMATYRMPDVAQSIGSLDQANAVLQQLQQLLNRYKVGDPVGVINLSILDADNRELIDQVLGEGEVSIVFSAATQIRIQEAVLAGVWRVQYLTADGNIEKDTIEVADIPAAIRGTTFSGDNIQQRIEKGLCLPGVNNAIPPGVNNAIPLLSELNDHIAQLAEAGNEVNEVHVINLTLLPQSEEDIAYLTQTLGQGPVTILSRGYGNCRVTSTATRNVWWVQYFNSQDAIILNTLEVTPVPVVVCASAEDIADSAQRLQEIREVYA
jgi:hydrogenase-1 operon protein HyaF